MTNREHHDAALRHSLLICWLPLAQEMNQEWNWHEDAAGLEALVTAAAPLLARIESLADARAVLYYAHVRLRGATQ